MELKNTFLSIENVIQEIEANKSEILSLFEKRLKDRVPLPVEINPNDLIVVIPKQLEVLIQTLIRFSASGSTVNTLAHEHAKLRAKDRTFTLEILISEFIVLKDVIFEILEKKGRIDTKASNLIWQYIVNAIRVAVTEFERERQNESSEMSERLDKSDSLNETISKQIVESRENEERYKTLVQGVDDYAVFTVDPKGFITSWNPGAARIKGYTPEEAIGNHFSMLYPELGAKKGEPMDHLHVALIEGRYRGEGLRRKKNGDLFLADVYIRPIFKDGKHLGFAKVVADVTERNKLMQASNLSKAEIGNLKNEKEQRQKFVMTLTHDLRGPLSVVKAASELLRRQLEPNEKVLKYIGKILYGVDRTDKMIGDLLDANRMLAGEKINLKIHEWDLVRLTRNVCDDFLTLGDRIELHTEQEEIKGEWDGEGLRRILENLISNAIKYGNNSYPVDVILMDLGDMVCIKVHNMGEVISVEDQKTLFDQFRRTSSAVKHNKGWGIGLSLVKGVTEAHGGTVEVASYPIEGTSFSVNLPKITKKN